MAVDERINQLDVEMQLYEIMRNPVLFGEFINNYDKTERDRTFEFTIYQKEWLLDFSSYVSICCSRAVGKTVFIVMLYTWMLVYNVFPEDYIVYGVPSKIHLEPVWTGLIRQFRTNSFLKMFIQKNSGINSADFKITLTNQATLLCRIAGQTGTGVSFIGLHEPVLALDESGYFPWQAFIESQPTLNTFTQGFKLIVSGVPDGRREKSVCYHADQENSSYAKHRVNSLENPRFTEEDRARAEEQYGGVESEDYTHLVLGEHGRPVFSLFDRSLMSLVSDSVYMLELDGMKLQEDITEYINRLASFPGFHNKEEQCLMGVDLGYTEPTAIIVARMDRVGRIHFHGRITLSKVSYPIQEKILDFLDTRFEPMMIGVDKGSTGISVIHHLEQDDAYRKKHYSERIVPIDFSTSMSMGFDQDGNEIKMKTKPLSVQVLQDYSNNHKIIYSTTDLEMVTELERMTYTKTATGEIVYRTLTARGGQRGADHFTSALLCLVLGYYMKHEYLSVKTPKVKLLRPGWI